MARILKKIFCNHTKCIKKLKKKYQEKWENAYLIVKNSRASRALRWALDPGLYYIAGFAHPTSLCYVSKISKKISGPPPTKSWIRYWNGFDHNKWYNWVHNITENELYLRSRRYARTFLAQVFKNRCALLMERKIWDCVRKWDFARKVIWAHFNTKANSCTQQLLQLPRNVETGNNNFILNIVKWNLFQELSSNDHYTILLKPYSSHHTLLEVRNTIKTNRASNMLILELWFWVHSHKKLFWNKSVSPCYFKIFHFRKVGQEFMQSCGKR